MLRSLVLASGVALAVAAAVLPPDRALPPLFGPSVAHAAPLGDYHEGTTLECAECHVMHTGAPPTELAGEWTPLDEARFVGELLREDVNDLCLSCHDGSSRAADVLGPNLGRRPGDVRQAGALNRLGGTGLPSTGHTLDSLAHAPGSSPPWSAEEENGPGKGLNCINCHGHHGSRRGERAYRNLRSDAGHNPPGRGLVTYNHEGGPNDLTRDVYVRRSLDYDEAALDFNEPSPRDSAMGRFCAGCHSLFHGAPGASRNVGGRRVGRFFETFLRHPGAGADIGAGSSSLARFASLGNRVKVMSPTGQWDLPPSGVSPTCITCHKAHGNGNAFGLIHRSGTGQSTEEGDTGGHSLEALCGQCHGELDGAP
jgi:hypothetical protein